MVGGIDGGILRLFLTAVGVICSFWKRKQDSRGSVGGRPKTQTFWKRKTWAIGKYFYHLFFFYVFPVF